MNPFGLLIVALGVLLVISGFRATQASKKQTSGGQSTQTSTAPGYGHPTGPNLGYGTVNGKPVKRTVL